MTAGDIINQCLRMALADKDSDLEYAFQVGERVCGIVRVYLDEYGDLMLEADDSEREYLSVKELRCELEKYDASQDVFFSVLNAEGKGELYYIKEGGSREVSEDVLVDCCELKSVLESNITANILRLRCGTINFTINSIYMDDDGHLCLESNEYEELDDYTVPMIVEELSSTGDDSQVYFYDQEAEDYYCILLGEATMDEKGDLWLDIQ